jgi:natural product precursor
MKSLRKMGLKEHSTLSNRQMKQVIGGYVTSCASFCGSDQPCMSEGTIGRCMDVVFFTLGWDGERSHFNDPLADGNWGSGHTTGCVCHYYPN